MVSNVEPRLFIPCVTAGIINGIVAKGKQKIPHILSDPPSAGAFFESDLVFFPVAH
jgi:hypothetical protein